MRGAASVSESATCRYSVIRDQRLDRAVPREAIGRIVDRVGRVRPDVVVTFGPDGAYGHPDHIAISQFTTAAMMTAGGWTGRLPRVEILLPGMVRATWDAYQSAVGTLRATVDASNGRLHPGRTGRSRR